MYGEEKKSILLPDSWCLWSRELTNIDDFDNPSDASIEQSCDETAKTKNVLETAKTQAEKSEEKFSTNEILEIPNPTQVIQSQRQTPRESREENEDRLWVNNTLKKLYESFPMMWSLKV